MNKLEISQKENNLANAIFYIDEIADLDSLNEVASSLASRRKVLRSQEIKAKKATISVGDTVSFEKDVGVKVIGTLTKINRTRVKVEVNSRDVGLRPVTWNVPLVNLYVWRGGSWKNTI